MQISYKQLTFLGLFACMAMKGQIIQADLAEDTESPMLFHPPQSSSAPILFRSSSPESPTEPQPDETLNDLMAPEPNQTDQIKAVILEQLDAIRTQDLSKAYYAFSSLDFQKSVPLDTFKIYMKQNLVFFRSRDFEIQNINFSGILVTVKGVLIDSNRRQTLVEYTFIQENGQWKIRKMDLIAPAASGAN